MMACVLLMIAMPVVCRMPKAIRAVMLMLSRQGTACYVAIAVIGMAITIVVRVIVFLIMGVQTALSAALCCANGITCGSRSAVM